MPGLPARSSLKPSDGGALLNVDRPQNPFTLTDEPDWKTGGNKTEGGHTFRYDRLKDRNSHRLSPESNGSQRLPLDISRDSLRNEVALRGPNLRSSSPSSVVSMSSNAAGQAAPPIPKKPALLSNRKHSQGSRSNEGGKSTSSGPPSGGQITLGDGARTGFPPPPQRTEQQKTYGQQATESNGPPLPPRRGGAIVSAPNGLMDDDDYGTSAIPSLQPMRRRQ